MIKKMRTDGFSVVGVVIAVLVIVALGAGGWFILQKDDESTQTNNTNRPPSSTTQNNQTNTQMDPSEGGRYLVIKEWNLRTQLPDNLIGKVTYVLGEPVSDPDGNVLVNAKIYVIPLDGSCPVAPESGGNYIDSSTQLIRSEKAKPFNSSRYRFNFKENIASDDNYNYHMNYGGIACTGPGTEKLETTLRDSLLGLKKYE